ncbi:MAG: PAS domain S-box protein [Verrucomicrobiota bacterium]
MKHSIDTHFVLVCWFDSNNKIIYANNAACQTLGYRREEVLNRTLSEIDSTATNQILKKMRTQLRRNGHLITESRLRRKSGSEFPVEISVSHVQFGGKEYHCGVAHDITELSDIRQRLTTLTGREREVLEQIVTGQLNKQIATVLDITEGTVKFHRGAVMKKMKVRSVAELVHLVSRGGIAPPPAHINKSATGLH